MEARGIMFEVDKQGQFIRLASLPMPKFFNLNENPFTMNLDLDVSVSDVQINYKEDGSLISTYMKNTGELCVKTKGSLLSDQAYDAKQHLFDADLYDSLKHLVQQHNCTVNMEWCAPHNRIIIGYQQPQLVILNARYHDTGEYIPHSTFQDILKTEFPVLYNNMVEDVYVQDQYSTVKQFVDSVSEQTGIEGYVVTLENGLTFKVKTNWYLSQHRAKDAVDTPRRLFECAIDEGTDDLRTLFHDNPYVLEKIAEMEQKAEEVFNPLVNRVEEFYEQNKHLDRKQYAIKGQQTFPKHEFGLVMNKYLGKPVDYKTFLKKHYKQYGINDEVPTNENE